MYGSPFNLFAFDLWLFPLASYVWIVLKYGLSSCSFSDRMSVVDHMQISIGNGNSPRLWLDLSRPIDSCSPRLQLAMWLGQMKIFRTMLCTLCQNYLIFYNMQLCGFHCIKGYSICILVIFPMYFYWLLWLPCEPQGVPVASCGQSVPNEFRH